MKSSGLHTEQPRFQALITSAGKFHPWDAMAPSVLWTFVARAQDKLFTATAETGCGGSTIVLSHLSRQHTAFAVEGENLTITALRKRADLLPDRVQFVEGQTKDTVSRHRFETELDLLLLDGPHAYPLPQIEFAYLFPHLRKGGCLVVDDMQIPSVHQLFEFLRQQPEVELEEIVARTAFFRRVALNAENCSEPDRWWLQGINRRLVWRYSWRDRLRNALRRRPQSG